MKAPLCLAPQAKHPWCPFEEGSPTAPAMSPAQGMSLCHSPPVQEASCLVDGARFYFFAAGDPLCLARGSCNQQSLILVSLLLSHMFPVRGPACASSAVLLGLDGCSVKPSRWTTSPSAPTTCCPAAVPRHQDALTYTCAWAGPSPTYSSAASACVCLAMP